ncbi:MAG: hypothetical protein EG828_15965 [Deltaproteobacteria bacterium]|nr:hypothetical protein [Deltaproteobacteria bacterium]
MASNFGITIDKNSAEYRLKLEGDFDATSAWELIYAIKKLPEDALKVAITTDGLKDLHPFGLHVFHRILRSLNGQSTRIVFVGSNASRLSPSNSRLVSYRRADREMNEDAVFDYAAFRKSD